MGPHDHGTTFALRAGLFVMVIAAVAAMMIWSLHGTTPREALAEAQAPAATEAPAAAPTPRSAPARTGAPAPAVAPAPAAAKPPAATEPAATAAAPVRESDRPLAPTSAPGPAIAQLESVSDAFKHVARVARPGVVQIRTRGTVSIDESERLVPVLASGSGIIFDTDGHILTNNHVIEKQTDIKVVLGDDREFPGTVVGADSKTDLAVLKIDAPGLTPLRFGDSDQVEVGDWVLAVGAPFGLTQTVTHGIVSAIGRSRVAELDITYQDFIQTDAAVNPGNSGGPLLNLRGEVIGVNTAIATSGESFNVGIAFSIPANMARRVATELTSKGTVTRGYLGILPVPVVAADVELFGLSGVQGVFVERVVTHSPADTAGLQVEDVILAINDVPVQNLTQFRTLIADILPEQDARLRIIRDRQEQALTVRLGLQPDDLRTPIVGTVGRPVTRLGLDVRTFRPGTVTVFDDETRGVWIASITDPLLLGEVKLGELITSCNDEKVTTYGDLVAALAKLAPGQPVRLEVMGDEETPHTVTIGATTRPAGE